MKKMILILIPLLLIIGLSAVEFEISGENRTRAAMYNDAAEDDGGHFDNRFNIGFDSQFHRNLQFRVAAQVGDVIWGNGGGGISTGMDIHIMELYLDYKIDAIDANISLGQLYWMDRMGLIMDDYFSGAMLSKTFAENINTELIWMKVAENNLTAQDDVNAFIAHAMIDGDMPLGAYLIYAQDDPADSQNFTIMPYLSMEMDQINLDAVAFMDLQMANDDEMGFGGALKANMDMSAFELGADVLVATEHGLTTISPWYQNGLYIYGIGKYHDGLNLYWNGLYEGNADLFASMVGSIKAPLNEKIKLFAAGGYLIDTGMEVNAGMDYELIPDLLHMQAYGAYGVHDNETNNYALGSTLKIEF
jgi:hypothetical protein